MVPPRASDRPGAVVVGGGVIGLACAWRLRQQGLPVTVVDPGEESRPATWAAGGMLAPLGEAGAPGPFLELALQSLAEYPAFVGELEQTSGLDLGLHLDGKLLTAATDRDVEVLKARHAWLREDGRDVRWCTGDEARLLEPALAPAVRAGLLLKGNGRVDPRRLHEALSRVVGAEGVRLVGGRADALETAAGRVSGIRCQDGTRIPARDVVVAAGAWSGNLSGLPRPLPVRPVKGQMLAFATPDRPLTRVATSPEAYLIPRDDPAGPRIVVGATTEEAGFDDSVTGPGQETLEAAARRLVPALARTPVVERWAGLRPGTPDDLPFLGPDPEVEGLFLATGHYRNGILLAPATARIVAASVARDRPQASRYPHAFSPGRGLAV